MLTELESRIHQHCQLIHEADTLEAIEKLRVQLLGKQGELTQLLKTIGQLPPEERPQMGQMINQAKYTIQEALEQKKEELNHIALQNKLNIPPIDVSLPGRGMQLGTLHPLTRTRYQLEELFVQAGFQIMGGPEIEQDALNFTALNIPEHHPARAMHDTFYLKNQPNLLLRTHTSTVQIHALKQLTPPLRVIATGPVYRCDSDMTHTPMFHQLEGMVINQTANFSELKGLLTHFLQVFFEKPNLVSRFRASYFPFTEPSAEVDIQCVLCEGQGCSVCSHTGWLEILGCGMVHPNVLRNANIDPEQYQGYAFGMGIDRLTLLRYGIPDLRLLFENDIRLLNQIR